MAEITVKENEILNVIKKHLVWIGPTEIGLKLGKPYNTASSYCTSALKNLLNQGLIVKSGGKYKAVHK